MPNLSHASTNTPFSGSWRLSGWPTMWNSFRTWRTMTILKGDWVGEPPDLPNGLQILNIMRYSPLSGGGWMWVCCYLESACLWQRSALFIWSGSKASSTTTTSTPLFPPSLPLPLLLRPAGRAETTTVKLRWAQLVVTLCQFHCVYLLSSAALTLHCGRCGPSSLLSSSSRSSWVSLCSSHCLAEWDR